MCLSYLFFQALESFATTTVSLITTVAWGVIVWLVTLSSRTKVIRTLVGNPNRVFELYFRGESDLSGHKTILFLEDGKIGGKFNQNEFRWSVAWGLLSIFSESGEVYSKFKWDKNQGRLVHINDPRLPSVMGQYIVPMYVPGTRMASGEE